MAILYFTSKSPSSSFFSCMRCSYELPISSRFHRSTVYKQFQKEVPHSPNSTNEFEHAPKIIAVCPSCHNKEAYFMSIQTRSADEPMTQFFVCTACRHRWKE
ncbi:Transcription factor S [Babesia sp. Xinjiang]|uniref:Transcription factor S n=1 Tax=Babesia sp. Xinjiang TaxID=462227 RepID=UPI000A230EAD|nr:Transcription factor S [Babesia sp. Xinjiang]ORM41523.1 Transcription factor S [Babesia sp. Xinjiang]